MPLLLDPLRRPTVLPREGDEVSTFSRDERWPGAIAPERWYALTSGPNSLDQANFDHGAPERDALGAPLPRSGALDRKYLPLQDVDLPFGGTFRVSERLARVLVELGCTGATLHEIPHLTPHRVSGHRMFRLEPQGWLGPVVDTRWFETTHPEALERMRRRQRKDSPDPERMPFRLPLHPLTLDGSRWNGLDLCTTPWFGIDSAEWRLPLLPGRVLQELVARVPGLACGAFEVHVAGELPARRAAPPVTLDAGPEPRPVALAATLAAIDARRKERHGAGDPATAAQLTELARAARFPLPKGYLSLLRRWNGLALYSRQHEYGVGFALCVWPSFRRAKRAEACVKYSNANEMELGDRVRSGTWFGFAEDIQGNVMWCLDAKGRVHGLGKEGLVYGAGVPFDVWLGDMVRDIDWMADHPDALGASEHLGEAGRM